MNYLRAQVNFGQLPAETADNPYLRRFLPASVGNFTCETVYLRPSKVNLHAPVLECSQNTFQILNVNWSSSHFDRKWRCECQIRRITLSIRWFERKIWYLIYHFSQIENWKFLRAYCNTTAVKVALECRLLRRLHACKKVQHMDFFFYLRLQVTFSASAVTFTCAVAWRPHGMWFICELRAVVGDFTD